MSEADTNAAAPRTADAAPRKKTGRGTYLVIGVGLALLSLFAACVFGFFSSTSQSTDDAAIGATQGILSAEVTGRVSSLLVAEGDRVSAGEVIARLDDSTPKAEEARAAVNEEYAAQNVRLAELKLEQARDDFARASVQMQSRVISQEQYDHLNQAFRAAQATLDIARTQEKLAEAEFAQVKTALGQTVLDSPVNGIVAKRWVTPGEVVQPAQAIYTLCDLNDVWIDANFKETQIRSIRVGDTATFTVDAFPGRHFRGKVENIGATTASAFALIPQDNGAGNFTKMTQRVPLRISIDRDEKYDPDPPSRLLPGMSVEVTVQTARE